MRPEPTTKPRPPFARRGLARLQSLDNAGGLKSDVMKLPVLPGFPNLNSRANLASVNRVRSPFPFPASAHLHANDYAHVLLAHSLNSVPDSTDIAQGELNGTQEAFE